MHLLKQFCYTGAMSHQLEFECHTCKAPTCFSLATLDKNQEFPCPSCNARYLLNDEGLKQQLKKFYALCAQIHESQEILSQASIGVDVGNTQVKIPFKLLLTRLSSCLDLVIGGKPCTISFRFEPLKKETYG